MASEMRMIDEFRDAVMDKFIELCRGNDFNKLTLLKIGDTIDRIYDRTYEKYSTLPTVDAVEVVRCKDCKHCDPESFHCDHPMGTSLPASRRPDDFCSYGERKDEK